MYGGSLRVSAYDEKYERLAAWFLEHQGLIEFTEEDVEDLAHEIDVAIDNWINRKDPRKKDLPL